MMEPKFLLDNFDINSDKLTQKKLIEIYKYYTAIYQEDIKIDFNTKEKVLMLPGIQAKWLCYTFEHSRELDSLNKLKEKTKESIINELPSQSLDSKKRSAILDNHERIKIINDKIHESEAIIEFLKEIYKNITNLSFTMKNLIELEKKEIGC